MKKYFVLVSMVSFLAGGLIAFYLSNNEAKAEDNLVSVDYEDMSTTVKDGAVTCNFTEVRRYRHSVTLERTITPATEWKAVEEASASGEVFVTVHADGTEEVTPIKRALARTWSSASEVN